jgi:FKBP12-rapamycin complex-associated protein
MTVNNELEQIDAAMGILKYAQLHHPDLVHETWHVKLQRWEDALEAYERKQLEAPDDFSLSLGRLRCMHALGDYQRASNLALMLSSGDISKDDRRRLAEEVIHTEFRLGHWDVLPIYMNELPQTSVDGCLFRAVFAVHQDDFTAARDLIDKTRLLLDSQLTTLIKESYNRAYNDLVIAQQLAELEEVIAYKQTNDPEKWEVIRRMWTRRLDFCSADVDVWERILSIRSLVVSPHEDVQTWTRFAALARENKRFYLALNILKGFGVSEDSAEQAFQYPQVHMAYLEHLSATGSLSRAFGGAEQLMQALTQLLEEGEHKAQEPNTGSGGRLSREELFLLKAQCHTKLAEWQLELLPFKDHPNIIPTVLHNLEQATKSASTCYKFWHNWAVFNYHLVAFITQRSVEDEASRSVSEGQHALVDAKVGPDLDDGKTLIKYVVCAVEGFFKAISLTGGQGLQDILRLLGLWFAHGGH